MCSILWSNPWGNDNSHASLQYGPNIYTGFRSTAKRKKKFSCISPISPPSCLPERRISLFSFGFCLGHLILGSTSLGSVQNLMTFAWHWQCRIVQGNARSVYFVRFVNSSSESRPKCWPFLLLCSLWLLSTRRDPYHAVSSNILFISFLSLLYCLCIDQCWADRFFTHMRMKYAHLQRGSISFQIVGFHRNGNAPGGIVETSFPRPPSNYTWR